MNGFWLSKETRDFCEGLRQDHCPGVEFCLISLNLGLSANSTSQQNILWLLSNVSLRRHRWYTGSKILLKLKKERWKTNGTCLSLPSSHSLALTAGDRLLLLPWQLYFFSSRLAQGLDVRFASFLGHPLTCFHLYYLGGGSICDITFFNTFVPGWRWCVLSCRIWDCTNDFWHSRWYGHWNWLRYIHRRWLA